MGEQMTERDGHLVAARELVEVRADRLVQVDKTVVDERQQRHGRDDLRHRGQVEEGFRGDGVAVAGGDVRAGRVDGLQRTGSDDVRQLPAHRVLDGGGRSQCGGIAEQSGELCVKLGRAGIRWYHVSIVAAPVAVGSRRHESARSHRGLST